MRTVIIGGGAAGLACAIKLKQSCPDHKVTILEHLDVVGKKILATGNGRCNLTNIKAQYYEITKEFFGSLGLVLRSDEEGRMYPYSNQATSVLEILTSACNKLGVEIAYNCNTKSIELTDGIYNVYTDKGTYWCENLVLATGGKSQSALGSDGSGYTLAKKLGHTVTDLSPALVQLKSSSRHCRALKGVRAKCNLAIEVNGEVAGSEYGELLFADYGISGIVVMNLAHLVNDKKIANGDHKVIATIDFVPEMSEEEIFEHYNKFGSLVGILPERLCAILKKQANNEADKIAKYAKSWRIIITGTKGYDFAQITKGGVERNQLDDSYQSILNKNLYVVGELTDNQFCCGGFNLDFAFASGVIAANNIAGV